MTTNNNPAKANNANNNVANNAITRKDATAVIKAANAEKNSFIAAARAIYNIAVGNSADAPDSAVKAAKRVCAYLKIDAAALKGAGVKELRQRCDAAWPLYYEVEGKRSKFPATLVKFNKLGDDREIYIAKPQNYIAALVGLAAAISAKDADGKEYGYESRAVVLTNPTADEDGNYTADSVTIVVYNKNGEIADKTPAECRTTAEAYARYLNLNKAANQAAQQARAMIFGKGDNTDK